MAIYQLNITTATGGAWSETIYPSPGSFLQYRLDYGDTATGADLDIVGAQTGFVYVNHDNLGTADLQRLPRYATSDEAGVASLYAGSGEPVEGVMRVDEPLTVSIANGGDDKTGTLYLWIA